MWNEAVHYIQSWCEKGLLVLYSYICWQEKKIDEIDCDYWNFEIYCWRMEMTDSFRLFFFEVIFSVQHVIHNILNYPQQLQRNFQSDSCILYNTGTTSVVTTRPFFSSVCVRVCEIVSIPSSVLVFQCQKIRSCILASAVPILLAALKKS